MDQKHGFEFNYQRHSKMILEANFPQNSNIVEQQLSKNTNPTSKQNIQFLLQNHSSSA
jgi:hypothetical protein